MPEYLSTIQLHFPENSNYTCIARGGGGRGGGGGAGWGRGGGVSIGYIRIHTTTWGLQIQHVVLLAFSSHIYMYNVFFL